MGCRSRRHLRRCIYLAFMKENLNQDHISPTQDPDSGEEVKKDFQGLVGSVRKFLTELLNIRRNTDQDAAREAIVAGISGIVVCLPIRVCGFMDL